MGLMRGSHAVCTTAELQTVSIGGKDIAVARSAIAIELFLKTVGKQV